jgi:hypothetical protein
MAPCTGRNGILQCDSFLPVKTSGEIEIWSKKQIWRFEKDKQGQN